MEEGFLAALGRLDRAMQEHVGLIHSCLCLRKIIPWECYLVENYARQIRPLLIKVNDLIDHYLEIVLQLQLDREPACVHGQVLVL